MVKSIPRFCSDSIIGPLVTASFPPCHSPKTGSFLHSLRNPWAAGAPRAAVPHRASCVERLLGVYLRAEPPCQRERSLHTPSLSTSVPCPQARQGCMSGCRCQASSLPSLGTHLEWTVSPSPPKGEGEHGSSSAAPTACGDGPLVLPARRLCTSDSLARPCTRRAGLGGDHRL